MRRLFIIGIAILVFSCKQNHEQPQAPLANDEMVLNDVAYGSNAQEKMDVYLPKNRDANTRVIVFIHGGGWFSGDKSDGKDGAVYFQQQGYVFISINYRLTRTPENNFHPAQVNDIGMVLNFLAGHLKVWGITDDRVTLFGGSAGGHLSLLYGYKYDQNKKAKAIVSISGPTDLTDSTTLQNNIGELSIEEIIESFIGVKMSDNLKAWQDASPINFISSSSPPTFFIHGTNDHTVPYHQSQIAYEKLKAAGVNTQLETLDGVDHDLIGVNWLDLLPKMQTFINSNEP